jgi:hypothetical protein
MESRKAAGKSGSAGRRAAFRLSSGWGSEGSTRANLAAGGYRLVSAVDRENAKNVFTAALRSPQLASRPARASGFCP